MVVLSVPKSNSKPKMTTIVVRGNSGLTRRQKAALRVSDESFPSLPSKVAKALVSAPRLDRDYKRFASAVASRSAGLRTSSSSKYMDMLIDPFVPTGCRYPDESIVPTGMVHLGTSETYTVDATAAAAGFFTILNWKARTASNTPGSYSATLMSPIAIGTLNAAIASGTYYKDYGTVQSNWRALAAVDRTLSCGLRVRHVGLPVSTYIPSGTLYFIQYQSGEDANAFASEAVCIQAVNARKGFCITTAELVSNGGHLHIPYLPQGPMSYVYSNDTDGSAGIPDAITTGAVAPNGGLIIIGFGVQAGVILRFDYSHHIEYIPKVAASGLIQTKVELPSVDLRQEIAERSFHVVDAIGGSTAMSELHVLRGGSDGRSPFRPENLRSNVSGSLGTIRAMLDTANSAAGLFGGGAGSGLQKLLGLAM